jgi:hypothetical protein
MLAFGHNSCEKQISRRQVVFTRPIPMQAFSLTHFSYRNCGFKLARPQLVMIETASALVRSFSFGTSSSQRSRKSQLTLRPMARAQIGLNDADFLKEFSCYV